MGKPDEKKPTETVTWGAPTFMREVERRSGTPVSACFQCHKCSTGCPIGPEMNLLPSQIMRLLHLGAEEDVLESEAIWLCASCEACTTRCPMGIDIAGVMDALRILAIERKVALPDSRTEKFNRSFLKSVRRHGRVFETGMLSFYKLRTGDFFSDVEKVPQMLAKKKLAFLPSRSRAAAQVKKVFQRAEEEEKKR
jgi:heterodisulfide reductase subunit C